MIKTLLSKLPAKKWQCGNPVAHAETAKQQKNGNSKRTTNNCSDTGFYGAKILVMIMHACDYGLITVNKYTSCPPQQVHFNNYNTQANIVKLLSKHVRDGRYLAVS